MQPVTPKLDLDELRRSIDAVDQQILKLLHDRVRLVMKVGEYKRENDIPVYDANRERDLFDRLGKAAEPPLDAETARSIFQRIVDECRRIEHHHVTPPPTAT
jgi:monofunctional chorismate mutase